MIFPKTQRVGLNFDQGVSLQPQFVSTKVAIIDKRNAQTGPQVFVISPESMIDTENLQELKANFLSGFCNGTFILMGKFRSIDRAKKMVKLLDDKLVTYQYLIVITNVKNHQNRDDVGELYTGLNALIDALRIKKNNTFTSHLENRSSRKLPPALEQKQVQILQDESKMIKPDNKAPLASSDWFFESDVLVYEVQT